MSLVFREEYMAVQCRRYKKAGRDYKSQLIDEVCAVCGYELKHIEQKKKTAGMPVS